jgi:hypothetical protein
VIINEDSVASPETNTAVVGCIERNGRVTLSFKTLSEGHPLCAPATAIYPMYAASIATLDSPPVVIQAPVGLASDSAAKSLVAQLARMARRAANDTQ